MAQWMALPRGLCRRLRPTASVRPVLRAGPFRWLGTSASTRMTTERARSTLGLPCEGSPSSSSSSSALPSDLTLAEVKEAWRRAAKNHHPDRAGVDAATDDGSPDDSAIKDINMARAHLESWLAGELEDDHDLHGGAPPWARHGAAAGAPFDPFMRQKRSAAQYQRDEDRRWEKSFDAKSWHGNNEKCAQSVLKAARERSGVARESWRNGNGSKGKSTNNTREKPVPTTSLLLVGVVLAGIVCLVRTFDKGTGGGVSDAPGRPKDQKRPPKKPPQQWQKY